MNAKIIDMSQDMLDNNMRQDKTTTMIRNNNRRHYLRCLYILLVIMVMGATDVWGQDYSGMYYIRNTGKNASATNLYYLCPTEGWYFYKASNNYQETDNEQPFLTTYKIKTDNYDISKAVWIVEKHPTKDCYYIKQRNTGRYIVSNGQIAGCGNANRVRIHLEAVADANALATLGDLALFEINDHDGHMDILPHATEGRNGNNIYLVANNGNYQQLKAEGSKPDFANGKYGKGTGGIIGLYEHENNAQWLLEDIPVPNMQLPEGYEMQSANFVINGLCLKRKK